MSQQVRRELGSSGSHVSHKALVMQSELPTLPFLPSMDVGSFLVQRWGPSLGTTFNYLEA